MFTGLVEGVGTVLSAERRGGSLRLLIDAGDVSGGVRVGDSIAVSGCCLSAVEVRGAQLAFDAVTETLDRTWLGRLTAGDHVNLERSLRVGDRLGGHLVQGHVDGVATVRERVPDPEPGGQVLFRFDVTPALVRDMIVKGSIALDGVSLTLTEVGEAHCAVALIPHTLAVTTLGGKQPGDPVNVETDMIGKWLRRIAAPYLGAAE